MRGEYRRETRPFHQRAVFRPTNRGVVGVRAQQGLREAGEGGVGFAWIDPADITRETLGAAEESGIAKVTDQGGDGVLGQTALVHAAGDCESDRQNRVAERVLVRARAQSRRELQEFLSEKGGR